MESAEATAMRRREMFLEKKKSLILGLISTKYTNKGNFKKKHKAKKQRIGIEKQVDSMRRQIHLMRTQASLKKKDLKFKQIEIKRKTEVSKFKRNLQNSKHKSLKKLQRENKKQVKRGKLLRSISQYNKNVRMQEILDNKRSMVMTTKSFFENALKNKADGRIRQIIKNKKQAQRIRKEKYQS